MIRNISIGIDVGTQTTRVVVGEKVKGEKNPKIIGIGEAPTLGLRHGYVTNFDEAVNSVKTAVSNAEKNCGVSIKRVSLSVGGSTLRSETVTGVAVISKADGEVTSLDVNKALEECEDNLNLNNKKIIEIVPISFRLDGKEVLGRLEGMRGTKLEVKALFITCSLQHYEDLISVLAEAGVESMEEVPSTVSGSYLALSERQKIVGVALANIGAETTSLAVFDNGLLVYAHTFPIGGADITNDIALGLKIPLGRAENFKLGNLPPDFSKKKLEEIIEARLSDIFELIENHLKKIKRNELLPAGIVFVGGGANTPLLVELSKEVLKLPSSIGFSEMFSNSKTKLRGPEWFSPLGLIMGGRESKNFVGDSLPGVFKDVSNSLKSLLKQLMP